MTRYKASIGCLRDVVLDGEHYDVQVHEWGSEGPRGEALLSEVVYVPLADPVPYGEVERILGLHGWERASDWEYGDTALYADVELLDG